MGSGLGQAFLSGLPFSGSQYDFFPDWLDRPIPVEVRLHFFLAFANILLAATLGLLSGADKKVEVLPGFTLHHVVAHAHLAALGWATMMVMAAGYRLLPMILPAAVPTGRWVWSTAIVMEVGVLGLTAALYLDSNWSIPFGGIVVLGLGIFLSRVSWMLRNPRPSPRALRRPDFGVLHAGYALVCLVLAAALGMAILVAPPAEWKLPAAMVYACLGLLGFLSQMVVGVASRLVPLFGWLRSFSKSEFQQLPPSPHDTPNRPVQRLTFFLWAVGIPLLIVGLATDAVSLIRLGASSLFVAVLAGLWQQGRVLSSQARSE